MKKIFLSFVFSVLSYNAFAACVEESRTYTSCKSPYVLSDGDCVLCGLNTYWDNGSCTTCPNGGTSKDGSDSITDCYIPSGTTGSNASGSFMYTSDCYYK